MSTSRTSRWNRGPRKEFVALGKWTPDVLEDKTSSINKTNLKLLSSYNTNFSTSHDIPTGNIVVPGSAPVWSPQQLPVTIPPDSELEKIENTPYRNLTPLFEAVFSTQPAFDPNSIDIVTDRSNLRQLLDFASGRHHKSFWICAETVNNTVLFTTMEVGAKPCLRASHGYGHQFKYSFTDFPVGVKGVTEYSRVVTYQFGGLKMLVRYKCDGILPSEVDDLTEALKGLSTGEPSSRPSKPRETANLSTRNVNSGPNWRNKSATPSWREDTTTPSWRDKPTEPVLKVVRSGDLAEQAPIMQLKTRAEGKAIFLDSIIPQLWFANTRNLLTGFHDNGTFTTVESEFFDDEKIAAWETENKANLGKLVDLLEQIAKVARSTPERTVIKGYAGEVVMENWYSNRSNADRAQKLPRHIRSKWRNSAR